MSCLLLQLWVGVLLPRYWKELTPALWVEHCLCGVARVHCSAVCADDMNLSSSWWCSFLCFSAICLIRTHPAVLITWSPFPLQELLFVATRPREQLFPMSAAAVLPFAFWWAPLCSVLRSQRLLLCSHGITAPVAAFARLWVLPQGRCGSACPRGAAGTRCSELQSSSCSG